MRSAYGVVCSVQVSGFRVQGLVLSVQGWTVTSSPARPWPSEGSYSRLIDSCITQLKAQGPSRTCNESKEEEEVEGGVAPVSDLVDATTVLHRDRVANVREFPVLSRTRLELTKYRLSIFVGHESVTFGEKSRNFLANVREFPVLERASPSAHSTLICTMHRPLWRINKFPSDSPTVQPPKSEIYGEPCEPRR